MTQAPPQYSNGQSLIRPGQYTTEPPRLIDPNTNEPFINDGAMALPHVFNFAAIWNYFNQTYSYRYDEALRTSWENALSMRRDTFIWGCLDERYLGVISNPWHIEPVSKDAEDGEKERAGELTELVRSIPKLLGFFRALEDAVWYGRYGAQMAFGATDINGIPQRGIARWVPVNGDKIQCEWDGVPAVMISPTKRGDYEKNGWTVKNGERSPLVYLDKPELRDRFAINQHWRDDADYFEGEMAGSVAGVGIRSRIYWSWWMRYEMLGWAVNYMRKVGTLGLLIFPFDEGNASSEAAAKTNARQAGNRSTLIMPVPRGSDPKHLAPQIVAPNTAGIDALTAMIDSYWERHIERFIVGQNMSDGSDNQSGLGGSGRANFAAASQYLKIKGDADMLAETMTQDVVRVLHKMNYPGEPFRFRFIFDVDDPKSKERLEAAKSIVDMGGTVKADDVREVGGFSKPNPEDEVLGQQQAAIPFGKGLDGQPLKTPMGFGGEKLPGGKGDNKADAEFDPSALAKGVKVEMEHTDDEATAREIAKDHLTEDPKYYDKLADMEAMQRDAMNDRQFAAAMERLAKLEANLMESRQQNYARSNDEAVMLLNQRINDLALQRYDSPSPPVTFQMQTKADESQVGVMRELVEAIREMKPPQVTVENTQPVVNVAAPNVTVEAAKVNVPSQAAPVVNVAAPVVNVPEQAAPLVTVNVPPPPEMEITEIERSPEGLIKRLIRKVTGKK